MTDNKQRDRFAEAALTGLIAAQAANHWSTSAVIASNREEFAKFAYAIADAMMRERAETKDFVP